MQISRSASGKRGFTLLEILVVVTIIGLLATIAISNVILARDRTRLTTIRHNLRKIEEAKEQWALENRQTNGAPVADVTVLQDYLRDGTVHQVMSETYLPNALGVPPEAALPAGAKLGPYGPGANIPAP
ncbi:MAG: prepilin-type N-terminal cleavage/methylation domain-containing protein [Verrucomicrobiota bacterium]